MILREFEDIVTPYEANADYREGKWATLPGHQMPWTLTKENHEAVARCFGYTAGAFFEKLGYAKKTSFSKIQSIPLHDKYHLMMKDKRPDYILLLPGQRETAPKKNLSVAALKNNRLAHAYGYSSLASLSNNVFSRTTLHKIKEKTSTLTSELIATFAQWAKTQALTSVTRPSSQASGEEEEEEESSAASSRLSADDGRDAKRNAPSQYAPVRPLAPAPASASILSIACPTVPLYSQDPAIQKQFEEIVVPPEANFEYREGKWATKPEDRMPWILTEENHRAVARCFGFSDIVAFLKELGYKKARFSKISESNLNNNYHKMMKTRRPDRALLLPAERESAPRKVLSIESIQNHTIYRAYGCLSLAKLNDKVFPKDTLSRFKTKPHRLKQEHIVKFNAWAETHPPESVTRPSSPALPVEVDSGAAPSPIYPGSTLNPSLLTLSQGAGFLPNPSNEFGGLKRDATRSPSAGPSNPPQRRRTKSPPPADFPDQDPTNPPHPFFEDHYFQDALDPELRSEEP